MRFASALALLVIVTSCGGSPAPSAVSPPPSGDTAGEGATAPAVTPRSEAPVASSGVQGRLQGTWEISRYTSDHRIPDDAMPLMGTLFESLRLRFERGRVIAGTSPSTEESCAFAIAGERGDEFTLIAKGGLFDGARCRFIDADTWEAIDHGPSWPGVSVLRRVSGAGGKGGSRAPGPNKLDRRGR